MGRGLFRGRWVSNVESPGGGFRVSTSSLPRSSSGSPAASPGGCLGVSRGAAGGRFQCFGSLRKGGFGMVFSSYLRTGEGSATLFIGVAWTRLGETAGGYLTTIRGVDQDGLGSG